MFFMFLKHQLIDIIPRCILFMCFFKLRLQSFLERKSREATCFPSHGDWLNTVTQSRRTGEPENSRGAHNCTVVTPPRPWSEMCHILWVWAQCGTMCLITAPSGRVQCGFYVGNKGARGEQKTLLSFVGSIKNSIQFCCNLSHVWAPPHFLVWLCLTQEASTGERER